ncbi:hypothetical protein [Novosphingobium sp.]|uniref:hypothetical protein n=1 Tax=Novosphingobium sp. TaxID=1874826 RepID=UPI003D09CB31
MIQPALLRSIPAVPRYAANETAALLERLADISTRPRYAFMVLGLVAQAAGPDGVAGPYVMTGQGPLPLRDWLCDGLAPMGRRDPRRVALAGRVRESLHNEGRLREAGESAERLVEAELRDRVRISGKTNLSRAISELVAGGLVTRHYKGFAVDHINRGGQRMAVYSLTGQARCLLPRNLPSSNSHKPPQLSLGF